MAGQRKLMSEIDRTLKKVSEGVDVFNEIWDKVYAASAQAQKEKHEADLKKEIKKLQRFRDQIKTWISNSDVKDKKPLVDARKLIEQKMEEFKVCEKETKTKAYSKEGLAQTERLDPAEAARQKSHGWIQDCLTQFNEQIEAVECDLERLQSAKGRNRNKAEMERLDQTLAKHKWHVLKLEQINRLLDNDALEPAQVDELKDDVDYYLEANQEPDFLETYGDDDIYESLDLDTLGAAVQVALPTEQDVGLDDSAAAQEPISSTGSASSRASAKTPKKSAASSSAIVGIGRAGAVKPIDLKSTPSRSSSSTSASVKSDSSPLSGAKAAVDDKAGGKAAASRGTPQRNKAGVPPIPTPNGQDKTTKAGANAVPPAAPSPSPAQQQQQHTPGRKVVSPPTPQKTPSPNGVAALKAPSSASSSSVASPSPVVAAPTHAPSPRASTPGLPPQPPAPAASTASVASVSISNALPPPAPTPSVPGTSASPTPPAATSLGFTAPPTELQAPLTEEQRQILRMIDESFHFVPESRDSDKTNRYVPRNVYPTPASFPASPAALFEKAAVFERLDVDTLFFIFYYQQGSYQQYLAARELKRRTWGYHKKYKTWFKRHEEPQVTGEDYEQGTFVYFDYETGWCQRIKTEFTFEYSYLEDELQ
jgi:CCR4-NOT transcription complex subunit 3